MNTKSRRPIDITVTEQEEEPPPSIHTGAPVIARETATTMPPLGSASAAAMPLASVRRRMLRMNPRGRLFRRLHFPQASDQEWSDWMWQYRHRICSLEILQRMVQLSPEEEQALQLANGALPTAITPHYMGLVSPLYADQPIRRAVIPTIHETRRSAGEEEDPLSEDNMSPVPGLVHRYPDRVLLLATDSCSAYCRYCTRSRMVGHGAIIAGADRLQAAFDYIARTPRVRDVLVSGGDPLTLSDERIEWILKNLRAIKHVEIIRIGTKVPAVLPQRVTPQLTRMLRKYHPLWMSLHFMHPDECCHETARACGMLADAGIPLGSQTVLLKGINDNLETMAALMHGVMKMRVRPYYIYQCDPIHGSAHFRTPVSKGLEIIRGLRGHTSGYAVPTFVIDAPGGGGKIPLAPNYVVGTEGNDLILSNYEGHQYRYPDYS